MTRSSSARKALLGAATAASNRPVRECKAAQVYQPPSQIKPPASKRGGRRKAKKSSATAASARRILSHSDKTSSKPKGKGRLLSSKLSKNSNVARKETKGMHHGVVKGTSEVKGSDEYEVKRILDSRIDAKGNRFYKVHWAGWSLGESTWEPEANLLNSQEKIKDFDVKFPNKP